MKGSSSIILVIILAIIVIGGAYLLLRNPVKESNLLPENSVAPKNIAAPKDNLIIEDIKIGTGDEAVIGSTVSVNYKGVLKDGTQFDSSYDRGEPFEFTLGSGQVIPGWDMGVERMKVGGQRRLTIPPELAYGELGVPGSIPPNSTLVFEIELLSTTPMDTTENPSEKPEAKVFAITGNNYAFSQKEIRVKKGDKVKIVFTSIEGFHDWVVDEFSAGTERVSEGDAPTSMEFIADQIGTFEFYCSVGNHRALGMVGNLVVE